MASLRGSGEAGSEWGHPPHGPAVAERGRAAGSSPVTRQNSSEDSGCSQASPHHRSGPVFLFPKKSVVKGNSLYKDNSMKREETTMTKDEELDAGLYYDFWDSG